MKLQNLGLSFFRCSGCPSISIMFNWLLALTWIELWTISGNFSVSANFNLFLDRREFQKLHGISSDIYYVREGVVNEYALNFLVTVPPEVDDLHFSWQAVTKKAVHYDMSMEFTDFYALLPPISNITNSGRVPHNLETFKVTLLCSGRSNSEVSVTIRMNFQVKHSKPKLNTTSINIKRNKICLLKDVTPKANLPELPLFADSELERNPNSVKPMANATLLFQETTPNLLLAGLLGGCTVTASIVFLVFFICLRNKLTQLPNQSPYGSSSSASTNDANSSSNKSSPACLLRQPQDQENDNQLWKNFSAETYQKRGTISSRSGSQNSYVTIASFWNDIFSTGSNSTRQAQSQFGFPPRNGNGSGNQLKGQQPDEHKKSVSSAKISDRGSDVSPYAYAHIIPKLPTTVPPPPKIGAPPPSLIEWYSQSPCQNVSLAKPSEQKNSGEMHFGHIYSNSMCTFNPNVNFSPKIVAVRDQGSEVLSLESVNLQQKHVDSPTALKSDCDRVVQIDGFQCRKDFDKESNVVERFL